MKTIRFLLIALALLGLLAVPAFAEPLDTTGEIETAIDPSAKTELALESPETTLSEEGLAREAYDSAAEGEPLNTGIAPFSADPEITPDLYEAAPSNYVQENALTLAALALGALALLLSLIALGKSGKQSGRKRTKNYF